MKAVIYSIASDDSKSGTESHVFGSEAERNAFLRSIMQDELEGSSADDEHIMAMRHHLDEDRIACAWTTYEEHIKDPLASYALECTEVDVPVPLIHYTRQLTEKSYCTCKLRVTLLAPRLAESFDAPAFYICWACRKVSQVAVGEVREG